ncbi:hypothetical protein F4604DRAFT_1676961 [Suillus subluteus]|nr:hypothetical protein F4604DRAFT_1676961 [Suillus subluteus]
MSTTPGQIVLDAQIKRHGKMQKKADDLALKESKEAKEAQVQMGLEHLACLQNKIEKVQEELLTKSMMEVDEVDDLQEADKNREDEITGAKKVKKTTKKGGRSLIKDAISNIMMQKKISEPSSKGEVCQPKGTAIEALPSNSTREEKGRSQDLRPEMFQPTEGPSPWMSDVMQDTSSTPNEPMMNTDARYPIRVEESDANGATGTRGPSAKRITDIVQIGWQAVSSLSALPKLQQQSIKTQETAICKLLEVLACLEEVQVGLQGLEGSVLEEMGMTRFYKELYDGFNKIPINDHSKFLQSVYEVWWGYTLRVDPEVFFRRRAARLCNGFDTARRLRAYLDMHTIYYLTANRAPHYVFQQSSTQWLHRFHKAYYPDVDDEDELTEKQKEVYKTPLQT